MARNTMEDLIEQKLNGIWSKYEREMYASNKSDYKPSNQTHQWVVDSMLMLSSKCQETMVSVTILNVLCSDQFEFSIMKIF
jgi:hypothetical protein